MEIFKCQNYLGSIEPGMWLTVGEKSKTTHQCRTLQFTCVQLKQKAHGPHCSPEYKKAWSEQISVYFSPGFTWLLAFLTIM